MLKFYNTKTREKEVFKPLKQDEVKVYFCGPTVYNYAHIWNFRTYIFEDIVTKTLRFLGYNVKTMMNITDVDDKTIKSSITSWETLKDFTVKYTEIFLSDIDKLWITRPDLVIPVTDLIPEMVRMINTMLKRWIAYIWDDKSIYFNIKKYSKYWKFANIDFSWQKESVRIDNDEYDKESAADFVLWKAWKPEDWANFWEEQFENPPAFSHPLDKGDSEETILAPLIKGESKGDLKLIKWRPGWHIECSACNMKYFWPQIDIHMWWIDLIFPHHQNEIAQTESCTRKEFSKYWIHTGHLMVDWKKMAKSADNFYTIEYLENKFLSDWKIKPKTLYRAIRFSFINWKYKDSVDFSFSKLDQIFNTLKAIDETLKNLVNYEKAIVDKFVKSPVSRDFRESMQDFIWEYVEKLEDDFNIPEALAIFFEFQKFVNIWIRDEKFSSVEVQSIIDMYKTFDEVLWIIDFSILDQKEEIIPQIVLDKFEARNKAKQDKDFSKADILRQEIEELWYKIIDSKEGSRVEKI